MEPTIYKRSTMVRTLMAAVMVTAFAFWPGSRTVEAADPHGSNASEQRKTYRIGFHWWKPGKIYDEAMAGIKDGLEIKGIKYEAVVLQSNRDKRLAAENLRKLDNMNLDLIYSFSSAGTQIAKGLSLKTPVIATVVNHPASLGVRHTGQTNGTIVTGTSYYVDASKQLALYRRLFANKSGSLNRVGMIYDRNNPAGALAEEPFMREACEKLGLKFHAIGVTRKSELTAAVNKLIANKVSMIVVPTNRLIYGNLKKILVSTNPAGVPVVSMNKQGVENGALAALFADTYNLGRQTANLAQKILKARADPSKLGFEYIDNPNIIINLKSARQLSYQFPAEILGTAAIVLQ